MTAGALPAAATLRIGVDARELQGHVTGVGRYLRSLLRAWPAPDELWLYFRGEAPSQLPTSPARLAARALGAHGGRGGLLWQERELTEAVRRDGLDVFFAPAYTCPLRLATPCVTTVHDLSFFSYPEDFGWLEAQRRRLLVAASLRRSRAILTVSQFSRDEIVRRFPETRGRVHAILHGADDDLAPAPPREQARLRLGLTGPLVLTVGSIFNRRRLPELLRAFAEVRRRVPGVVLDVVGANRTSPHVDLAALGQALGLGAALRLSDFVDEAGLADRYAAADVAVFLSEYEGFGLPALEAAARGVPLLIGNRPALSEIFGSSARVTDARDVPAVAEGLTGLLEDPQARTALRLRGLRLAASLRWADAAVATRAVLAAAR